MYTRAGVSGFVHVCLHVSAHLCVALCLCVHVCVCMHLCVCVCVRAHVQVHVSLCVCLHTRIWLLVCRCTSVCVSGCVWVYIYICVHLCVHVCVHALTCVYACVCACVCIHVIMCVSVFACVGVSVSPFVCSCTWISAHACERVCVCVCKPGRNKQGNASGGSTGPRCVGIRVCTHAWPWAAHGSRGDAGSHSLGRNGACVRVSVSPHPTLHRALVQEPERAMGCSGRALQQRCPAAPGQGGPLNPMGHPAWSLLLGFCPLCFINYLKKGCCSSPEQSEPSWVASAASRHASAQCCQPLWMLWLLK